MLSTGQMMYNSDQKTEKIELVGYDYLIKQNDIFITK